MNTVKTELETRVENNGATACAKTSSNSIIITWTQVIIVGLLLAVFVAFQIYFINDLIKEVEILKSYHERKQHD